MKHSSFKTQHSSFAAGVKIPFEVKMKELSETLYQQMSESAELDMAIRENLTRIGYCE